MSIEKRLTNHMAEQSERLAFPASDPEDIINRPPSGGGRAITTLAALVVVLAAGFGFWSLSQSDGSTEIAAGENSEEADDDASDDASDEDGDAEGSGEAPAASDAFVGLTITDVTGENSPGNGRVTHDDGVYYVLATAPGRVRFDENMTEEDYNRIFRPNTFYTLADGSWEANKVEDRFVSAYEIDGGVIYALSTGTLSGDETAAFGTSSDRGRSWDWQPMPDLPFVSQAGLLRADGTTILVGTRWGSPGYEETIRTARDAGVDVTEESLRNFDSTGFSYVPIDSSDQCAVLSLRYGLADMADWFRNAPESEREMAMEEIGYMVAEIGPEFEQAGCDLPLESVEDLDDLAALDLPVPVTVTWDEIGVVVPERWKPWSGAFRLDDDGLTSLDLPFDFSAEQIGYMENLDGQLSVMTYPTVGDAVEEPGEVRWTTSNGVDWNRQVYNYDEGGPWYGPGYRQPIAGDVAFETYWVEPSEEDMAAYEEQMMAVDRGELDIEDVDHSLTAEFNSARLRRSVAGGPWEDVDPAALLPGVDLDGRVFQQLIGTEYGVFLTFTDVGHFTGPPEGGQLIAYSNNGVDWGTFEVEGAWITFNSGDGGEVLAFDNRWVETETGGRDESTVLLLTPEG